MTPPSGDVADARGRRLVLTGLLLGIALAALDQTIVSTALPRIVSELGGIERYTLLIAGYMLSSTLVIPLAGKLSDRHGRRPVFLAGMGLFLLGSMLCGIAQTMDQLVVFRFLQGLGGGAMFPVAFAIIADLYPPSDRGKVQGAFSGVWGIASIVGPTLGGLIVDHSDWRWVFYVNVPVGALAIAVTYTHFPRITPDLRHPLDVRGAVLLGAAITAFIVLALFGGVEFDWVSPASVGLALLALAAAVLFLRQERRAPDPVLPLGMFREPVIRWSIAAVMLLGVAMFGVIAFLPLFLQGVIGITATNSGLVLMPMMLLIVAGAASSGKALPKLGYKKFILVGPALVVLGLLLLFRLTPSSPQLEALGYTALVGLGLGFTMATYMVAVQNVVSPRLIGTATSTITLARSLGATLGIAVLGGVFNHLLPQELGARLPADLVARFREGAAGGGGAFGPGGLAQFPPGVAEAFREGLGAAITPLFLLGAAASLLALLASVKVPEVRLKGRDEYFRAAAMAGEGGPPPAGAPALAASQASGIPAPRRSVAGSAVAAAAVMPPPALGPHLAGVRHEPPAPEPGAWVTTIARLEPRNGGAAARVEVRVAGALVGQARTEVPAGGAEVRVRWKAPPLPGAVTVSVGPG